MIKFIKIPTILILALLIAACSTTSENEKSTFNPKDFAKEQSVIIDETASMGPKSQEKNLSNEKRRIYIDENMVTDYTKIISKNFAETFSISVNFLELTRMVLNLSLYIYYVIR